jgi:integrase
LKPLLAIGFWIGWRVGEIRGLRREQLNFLDKLIRLNPGETKNNAGWSAPMTSELIQILKARYATRPRNLPFVCYRVDKVGRPERVMSFCRAWRNHCVKLGLGRWVAAPDPATGKQLYNAPRGPRSKPKGKMVYEGKLFHHLRRTGVRNLIRAGVPQSIAMRFSGHRTTSVFHRCDIVDERDVLAAGRKLERLFGDNSGTISGLRDATQNVTH